MRADLLKLLLCFENQKFEKFHLDMAEFYREILLVKVDVVDDNNTFGGLKVCQKKKKHLLIKLFTIR